jgi:hypothetical protein
LTVAHGETHGLLLFSGITAILARLFGVKSGFLLLSTLQYECCTGVFDYKTAYVRQVSGVN